MVGTRSSAPREDAAVLLESKRGTKHFRLIWPQVKKRGWTSKPPPSRGVETRWNYILPGGNANGTIGIDYVLGEQAVVDHATNRKNKKKRSPTRRGYDELEQADSSRSAESNTTGHGTTELIDLSGNNADEANNCRDDDCNYQVLDSGDTSEEDDLNDLDGSDSEVSVADTIDEVDEEAFENEERHFADHFLESMGFEEQVLAGEILGPALKEISTTWWH
ncbi:hypothetical protein PPTG_19052 [Phytophthora nicotianae INRA-310]|uniref:Uncharacterized protein n=1 Tax=Phytophthora nicotianae (strain INRA-310) TaxID=761204 RepID=W2PDE1_PHYN3|nr:hypothetical protein PPTG_19052 [Phytophthora nicotianae INRA-310]ETM99067.1 hypothetical protein PPTG_19052 [Phytophthora nicotianae INRA-310]